MTGDVIQRLGSLGFSQADAAILADHFLHAEQRGKLGHGLARVSPSLAYEGRARVALGWTRLLTEARSGIGS
ncbi:MAG: hypothetical protein C4306_12270 [Thermoleophilia bacterium]